MKSTNPPALAAWLLDRFAPGPCKESLAGDLLEEFGSGRTVGWYWRQVIVAIAIASVRRFSAPATAMLYAMAWTALVPAWLRAIGEIEQQFDLTRRFGQMDCPGSVLCDWGLLLAANLVYIGAGIALFMLPHLWSARGLRLRSLTRGLLAGLPTFFALWATLIVLPKMFLLENSANASAYSPAADAVPHLRVAAMVVRLPFFLVVLAALWRTTSRPPNHGASLTS